jgi:hypothetical protein
MSEPEISFSARLGEVFGKVHQEPKVARYLAQEADERARWRAEDDRARLQLQEAVHALAMDIRLMQSIL